MHNSCFKTNSILIYEYSFVLIDRTVIAYTKSLDSTRPVTFVSNAEYNTDVAVSNVVVHVP